MHVEVDAARWHAGERLDRTPSREDEGHSRDALQALVRAGRDEVDAVLRDVEPLAEERAHRIHDDASPERVRHPRHFGDGIEQARGGLVMHERDPTGLRMLAQRALDGRRVDGREDVRLDRVETDVVCARDPRDPVAVDAVVDDEHRAVTRHRGRDDGFDRRRARAREEHGGDVGAGARERHEALAAAPHHLEALGLAMAEVVHDERLTHGRRGVRGPGIEQDPHGRLLSLPQRIAMGATVEPVAPFSLSGCITNAN